MGQFRHHHSEKTRTMALFWLRTSYHAQCNMLQRYMLRSLLTQSSNIVNTPIILLFSKKWVPGFAAEDNIYFEILLKESLDFGKNHFCDFIEQNTLERQHITHITV